MITFDVLTELALHPNAALVASLVGPLNDAMPALCEGADDAHASLRRAHFIAQCCYETGSFRRLSEDLNYSAVRIANLWPALKSRAEALAHNPERLGNAIYTDRFGNGDEASGDGYRYRGRGLLQHTFRANYAELGKHLDLDLLGSPDLLLIPDHAVQAALYFWKSRGCDAAADDDRIDDVTRRISASTGTVADRAFFKHRALKLNL